MANRTGKGNNIPELERMTPGRSLAPAVRYGATAPVAQNAGEPSLKMATNLMRVTDKVNDRADMIARNEAADAGMRIAGERDVQLRNDGTITGEAFDASAARTMIARHDTTSRQKAEEIFSRHEADPAGLSNALGQYKQGVLASDLPQVVKTEFENGFDRIQTGYMAAARRAAQARQLDQDRATAFAAIEERRKTIDRLSMRADDDPASAAQLTEEIKSLQDFMLSYGPKGQFSFDGTQYQANGGRAGAFDLEAIQKVMIDVTDRAHEQRVVGKFMRLSSTGDQARYLQAFTDEYASGQSDFGLEQAEGLMRRMRSELSARESLQSGQTASIRAQVKDVKTVLEAGFNPGTAMLDDLQSRTELAGNAAMANEIKEARSLFEFQDVARKLPPADLQAWINTENTRLQSSKEVAPYNVERLNLAEKLLGTMNTELARDPMSWASRAGVVAVQPIVFNGDDAIPSMQARVQAAHQVSARYDVPLMPLTDEEGGQLNAAYNTMDGGQKIQLVRTLSEGFGSALPQALAPLAKDNPTLVHAAIYARSGPGRMVADQILEGDAAIRSGVKIIPPETNANVARAVTDTVGNAYSFDPRTGQAVMDTAKAIYTAKANRRGIATSDDFDPDLFEQSLQEASGATFDRSGQQYGGLAEWRDGTRIVLPSGMRADEFETTFATLTDQDLILGSIGGTAPKDVKGRAITAADLADHSPFLISIGNGRYRMGFSNPRGGDPGFFIGSGSGGFYELDLNQLKDAQRKVAR